MVWPDYVKVGEIASARDMQLDILAACDGRLAAGGLPGVVVDYYEIIRAHARLDMANHNHGKLRTLVNADGTAYNNDPANLNKAWDNVRRAFDNVVMLPNPTLSQLQLAMTGIEHGAGGG